MRRRVAILVVLVLVPVLVLAVEVVVARLRPRLDDEVGFRPSRLEVRPGPEPVHVVWLGDSTATGVGTARVEDTMAYRVASGLTSAPVELTILARSGDQVHEVHEVLDHQLDALARAGAVDVVLVSVGANDVTALTRRPTFRERYATLLDRLAVLVPEAEVVAVGIPDMGTAPRLPVPLRQLAGVRAAQLDDDVADLAGDRDVQHVELSVTGATFSSDPDRYFAGDGYHPSGPGHGVWADAVLASIGTTRR